MYEDIIKKLRAWLTIIGSGISIGFLIGCITALNVNPENAKYYFWGFLIGGFICGILLSFFLKKTDLFQEGFEPLNRSADLDDFQDKFRNIHQDDNVLKLIPTLTDSEFISLICFRYPQMLNETKKIMKQELNKRGIDKKLFYRYYNSLEIFRTKNENQCPKCGFHKYKQKTEKGILNCELCGYYDKLENPDKLINRLKKVLGFYYDIGLSESKIENELFVESIATSNLNNT